MIFAEVDWRSKIGVGVNGVGTCCARGIGIAAIGVWVIGAWEIGVWLFGVGVIGVGLIGAGATTSSMRSEKVTVSSFNKA